VAGEAAGIAERRENAVRPRRSVEMNVHRYVQIGRERADGAAANAVTSGRRTPPASEISGSGAAGSPRLAVPRANVVVREAQLNAEQDSTCRTY